MSDFRNTRISERKYYRIDPIKLTANGGIDGQVTVPNTYCFKVGQKVTLRSDTNQPRVYKVKKVESETLLRVGPTKSGSAITDYSDISDMTVVDSAEIVLPEQNRPGLDSTEVISYVFEEEPTVALRNHSVDWLGRSYDESNPFPVQLSDGSIDIGTVNAELEVQLSHKDDDPDAGDVHDSVRIGGTEHEAEVTSTKRLRVDTVISPPDPNDNPKEAIMCATDVHVDYTWQEIDGVRRITQILWSSASVAAELSLTTAAVQRDYTYNGSDPYDLIDRDDSLNLVP